MIGPALEKILTSIGQGKTPTRLLPIAWVPSVQRNFLYVGFLKIFQMLQTNGKKMEKDTTLRHRFAFCKMVPHHKQKQVSQWKPALPYVRDCVPVRKKAERLLPQLVCHVCELPPKLVPQKGSAPNLLAAGCRGKYPQMPAAEGQVVVGMENQGRLCWHDHHAEHFLCRALFPS